MSQPTRELPTTLRGNECTASVSIDSLERLEEEIQRSIEAENAYDSLNQSNDNEIKSPSFVNVLSSSLDEYNENGHAESFNSVFTFSDGVKNAGLPPRPIPRPLNRAKGKENMEMSTSFGITNVPSPLNSAPAETHLKECQIFQPAASNKSFDINSAAMIDLRSNQNSRIPVPVRSKTFSFLELSEDITTPGNDTDAKDAAPETKIEVTLSLDVAIPSPGAPSRARSHHTIECPKKDFIQLNKHGDFRRTKTYHSLHSDNQKTEKSVDQSDGTQITYSGDNIGHGPEEAAVAKGDITEHRLSQGHTSPTRGASPRRSASTKPPDDIPAPGQHQPPSPRSCSTPVSQCDDEERRRSRIPVRVGAGPCSGSRRRTGADYSAEFHESRLSYSAGSQSEWDLALRLPTSRHSLIDVNDNRALVVEGSAPCLLQTSPRPYQQGGGRTELVLVGDVRRPARKPSARAAREYPLVVYTPPERVIVAPRKVPFKPNLKPYPRKYINMGKLGPDPETVKQRQEKVRRKQEYADEVGRKNRAAVKRIGYAQQPAPDGTLTTLQKMADYAKTVPKPRLKPKSTSPEPIPPEGWPMARIRQLLTSDGGELSAPANPLSSCAAPAAKPPPPARVKAGHTEPRPVRRPAQWESATSAVAPPPPVTSPPPYGRPPAQPRARRAGVAVRSGGGGAGRARLTSSLERLRSLTARLVSADGTAADQAVAVRGSASDDSRTTLGSEPVSQCSADSLLADPGLPPLVVTLGHSRGARSTHGRGHLPPVVSVAARRPTVARCSRAVGPDGSAAAGGAPRHPSVEDVFYDSLERPEACQWAWTPRRPAVTRGTQAQLLSAARSDPLVVDIGLPVRGGAATTRIRGRRQLSPDSLTGSPREWPSMTADLLSDSPTLSASPLRPPGLPLTPGHLTDSIQRLHERHLRDKRRVDELLAGSLPPRY